MTGKTSTRTDARGWRNHPEFRQPLPMIQIQADDGGLRIYYRRFGP